MSASVRKTWKTLPRLKNYKSNKVNGLLEEKGSKEIAQTSVGQQGILKRKAAEETE